LVEDVTNYLRNEIGNGILTQGEKLSEISLQKKFGTSRSPIREALRILEREGLVVIHPRKGAYVSNITFEDLNNITIVRANLESLAAQLAIPNLTLENLENMETLLNKMQEETQKLSVIEFTSTHNKFHESFIFACGNRILIDILSKLRRQFFRPEVTSHYFMNNIDNAYNSHLKIIKALKNRDPSEVENAVKNDIITAFSYDKGFWEKSNLTGREEET